MGLVDILDKYANRTDAADSKDAHPHFDEVAAAAGVSASEVT